MDDEKALLRAILTEPGDEVVLSVYADWLEERGDPRGEYLRLRAALNDRPRRGARELQDRLRSLRAVIDPGWLPLLDGEGCRERDGWDLLIGTKCWTVRSLKAARARLARVEQEAAVFLILYCDEDDQFMVHVREERACVSFVHDDEWRSRDHRPEDKGRHKRGGAG
jgi:uncharacterized protein (TIGR02996 family)